MQNTSIFDHDIGSFKTRYKKGIKKKRKEKRRRRGNQFDIYICTVVIKNIYILINTIRILIISSFVSIFDIFMRRISLRSEAETSKEN